MADKRRLPNLFHRIFLSHLLVVLLCFVVAVVTLDYLFVDGVSHFILRSPLILIPVMLAMIGVVGLLALWTAGSAAFPIDRTIEALQKHDATAALARILPEARIEEVAVLIEAVHHQLSREPARRPLFLRLDRHGNVRDCDVDTAARLGRVPDELRHSNIRAFLDTPRDYDSLRDACISNIAAATPTALSLRFRGAAGRILPTDCLLYALPGDETLLIGYPGIPS